ncbi:glycosyltransferase family 4 protein [Roseococcus sp. SDR]|uniref:glycosyltransferase family 4 protein n=1 Tax=Roseococcus sp. SDR TaxID=2835532 RepID=UPI001BCB4FA6|nr:glycosyltransferase family 4 protein [Roseococcus sp. SDR]MBS7790461.1 glycosyltransferase family 4 protein [Roseococcus sp. SDR]MBV1845775.1 glycosyltransferase family 4 protein [Roseococcus sp. SDR]
MSLPPAILQVLPALDAGGVERGTLEIAEAIQAAGWRALVASAGGRLVPALEATGARHITLPLATKSPFAIWRNAAALADLVRAERVSILHARSRAPAWSAWLAARRCGIPFVTTYHGTYGEGFPGKRLYNSIMARGDRVIAISRHIADHIRVTHGLASLVIPRGVDPRRFDPALVAPERIAALRAAWDIPPDAPVILLPARLTRWKGQAVLIEALAEIPGAIAVLAGDPQGRDAYVASLRALAEQRGVADRLRIPGHIADMPAALLAADVVVHASIEPEAFGRTVIEAQAMGRPIIAADLGGPRETVEHGVTGWLTPAGDAAALAAQINAALALPPEARAALGGAARSRVPTMEAMQAATLGLYRELLP